MASADKPQRQLSALLGRYPDRLRAFCSVNPLKPYAIEELERCSRDPQLRQGLKLHFGNSDVDFDNPRKVAQVRDVLRAANGHRMAIVVHMHPSISNHRNYGADQARVFLTELLPAAADVPVQIAHMGGAGGYDDETDAALGVFVDAITQRDPRMQNVWFDATVVTREIPTGNREQLAARIRQIGVGRVLYGSDTATSRDSAPGEVWQAFRRLPLTETEFRAIAGNVAPYMRW